MRLKRPLTISAIAVAGVLALAACTDSGAPTTEETSAAPEEVIEFEAGATMAALNEAGAITFGTKFDQPLFGQVDADGKPQGFDVEIAKIIAAEARDPRGRDHLDRDRVRQPRAVHPVG